MIPTNASKFNTHLRLRQKTCRLHSASKLCRGKGSFDLVCIRFVFDLFGVGVSNKSIQISLLQPPHAHSARLPDCASLNLLPTSYMWSSIVLTNWMPWTFCFGRSGVQSADVQREDRFMTPAMSFNRSIAARCFLAGDKGLLWHHQKRHGCPSCSAFRPWHCKQCNKQTFELLFGG